MSEAKEAPGRPDNPNFQESAKWYDEGYFKGRQDLAKELREWLDIDVPKTLQFVVGVVNVQDVRAKLDELVGKGSVRGEE